MKCSIAVSIVAISAAIFYLVEFGIGGRSLTGTYSYIGSRNEATLILRDDHTYEFWTPKSPHEAGVYGVEIINGKPSDRIGFSGPEFKKFSVYGVGNITYSGISCPCILFNWPNSTVYFGKISD